MNQYFREDPIVAVSTSTQSQSAIGIIRITGFTSLDFLKPLCGLSRVKPRYAHYITLKDNLETLDDGLLLYFPAPHSFTGENVIEFHVHGNPFNLERIVSLLIKDFGFLKAFPGEFTYRALRNKKMNLTQVEGLDLLLNATSSFGLSQATKIMNNELFDEYESLRKIYISLRSAIELSIDFSEDVGEDEVQELIKKHTIAFSKAIDILYKRTEGDLNNLLTPKIGLFGQTNAGKSTLFNFLVGQDRAIVSDIHGTTRDFVSEYIYINSQAYQLIDTAGLRESNDVIEKEGIERGRKLIAHSLLKFHLIDATTWDGTLNEVEPSAYIFTHVDLLKEADIASLQRRICKLTKPVFISGPMGAPSRLGPIEPVSEKVGPMGASNIPTSGPIEPDNKDFNIGPIGPQCNYQFGPMGPVLFFNGPMGAEFIEDIGPMGANEGSSSGPIEPVYSLNQMISDTYSLLSRNNPIPLSRHRDVILDIYDKFSGFKQNIFNNVDLGIISHEINLLSVPIDELLGVTSPDDVLDNIFSNFCIGK